MDVVPVNIVSGCPNANLDKANLPMVRRVVSAIALFTVWDGCARLVIPLIPRLNTVGGLLPNTLAPHHVLAFYLSTMIHDPFRNGLAFVALDL